MQEMMLLLEKAAEWVEERPAVGIEFHQIQFVTQKKRTAGRVLGKTMGGDRVVKDYILSSESIVL